jgi:adenine-specific DNA-methyltransferase
VRNRPNAVILDFFAGSGTTCHATFYLNGHDEGRRQCILVTNNELPEEESKALRLKKTFPGDFEYEAHGIANSVTWPRCKFAIHGHRDDGTALAGEYLDGQEMVEGFEENMEYFRLDFADPARVERGDAFEGIVPILWLIAGAIGERESRRGTTPWYIASHSHFAVLIRETKFNEFREALREHREIACVFLVTDSDDNFAAMRRDLGRHYRCIQLYKSYLENFRINTVDRGAAAHDQESE